MNNSSRTATSWKYPVALALMLLVYMVTAFRLEIYGQYASAAGQPSTVDKSQTGAGAGYTLLKNLGYPVRQLTYSWNTVHSESRVLFSFQPFERNPDQQEVRDLLKWIQGGGTLIIGTSDQPQPADSQDHIAGDVIVIKVKETKPFQVTPVVQSDLTHGVNTISVSSSVRLAGFDPHIYTVLFKDAAGAIAIDKKIGKGRVIILADELLVTNSGIGQADNAIFLVNMAKSADPKNQQSIAFDEYHHGIGFATDVSGPGSRLYALLPVPVKWILGLVTLLCGVLLAGSVTRSIPPVEPPEVPRKAMDHVRSMAHLYQRSGAYGLALRAIYIALITDLRLKLHVTADTSPDELLQLARKTEEYIPYSDTLQSIITRCSVAENGGAVSESELVEISSLTDQFRRDTGLVGHR